jgi:ribonuclease-3
MGLGAVLRIGVGEDRSGGRTKASLLADSMEAVFGALYLDGGLEVARKIVVPMLEMAFEERASRTVTDPKTQLQEVSQALGWDLPEYRLTASSGPDHNKVFVVECWLAGELGGTGEGPSKKVAEQQAAADALAKLPEK